MFKFDDNEVLDFMSIGSQVINSVTRTDPNDLDDDTYQQLSDLLHYIIDSMFIMNKFRNSEKVS